MSNKKYWSSLDELNETPQYKEQASKEFNYMEETDADASESGTNRRDFLKVMGFSVSLRLLLLQHVRYLHTKQFLILST
jgi:MoCo/4Fe-4S cofactor protein with predicted Tat translocation signal